MVSRLALLAALLSTLPSRGLGQPGSCAGTLSGAVKAAFTCSVTARPAGNGEVAFEILPDGPVAGLRRLSPASFRIPGRPAIQGYSLETLGAGESSLETARGKIYRAAREGRVRGEVLLTLDTVERERVGGFTVTGTLRARLAPVEPGQGDGVLVEISF